MRSKELDRKKAVKLLERDLLNGPSHCFGIHNSCCSYFCSVVKLQELSAPPENEQQADSVENEQQADNVDEDPVNGSDEDFFTGMFL